MEEDEEKEKPTKKNPTFTNTSSSSKVLATGGTTPPPPPPAVPSKYPLGLGVGEMNVWPNIRPFLSGGLAGAIASYPHYFWFIFRYHYYVNHARFHYGPQGAAIVSDMLKPGLRDVLMPMRFNLLVAALDKAFLLGPYEILTKKVRVTNHGRPLKFYEEVGCGVVSGTIGTVVCHPLVSVTLSMESDAAQMVEHQFTCTNAFKILHHRARIEGITVLWKGARNSAHAAIPYSVGMLPSYYRSLDYFKESVGLGEFVPILGAGAVSGLSASVCASAWVHVLSEGYIKFHTTLLGHLGRIPYIMGSWMAWEQIKKIEKFIGVDGE